VVSGRQDKGKHAWLDVDKAVDGRRHDATQDTHERDSGGLGDDKHKDAAEYWEDEGP